MQDILTLQSEVAQAIAREIHITVTPEEEARLAHTRPVNPDVYEACLRAQFLLTYYRSEEAREYIQEAINKDPTYAPAYALLASYYMQLAYHSDAAPKAVFPPARAAATKALELDATLAEAHEALAFIRTAYDWDWSGAERQYRRALDLNPGLSSARSSYSLFLSAMGRHEEAIAEAKKAQELDPLSPSSNWPLGTAFRVARRYDEAIEQLQETIEMFPDVGMGYCQLAWAYRQSKMYEETVDAFQKAITLPGGDNLRTKSNLAHAYARSGRRAEALEILDELHELEKRSYVPPGYVTLIYIGLGKKEEALQWLEKAYEVRDADMFMFKFIPLEPLNDAIRDDPRYQDLLRRMNFPQ
jgi:tetratricopeptide (TPR) repeat protein